eukprot:CAMPEP_0116892252 /NCGR_PEP_ID=MMETSP0467-20121206/2513_1 /TAXON_ID=283647 /ORGANISM="Mesodinium pulex, Strain SPMC105" /LENGTH=53 /DNA_ID=CAMNT_0004561271 /DNA_START=479 /DNA_END=640 /DNA_ORIENTATION=+
MKGVLKKNDQVDLNVRKLDQNLEFNEAKMQQLNEEFNLLKGLKQEKERGNNAN